MGDVADVLLRGVVAPADRAVAGGGRPGLGQEGRQPGPVERGDVESAADVGERRTGADGGGEGGPGQLPALLPGQRGDGRADHPLAAVLPQQPQAMLVQRAPHPAPPVRRVHHQLGAGGLGVVQRVQVQTDPTGGHPVEPGHRPAGVDPRHRMPERRPEPPPTQRREVRLVQGLGRDRNPVRLVERGVVVRVERGDGDGHGASLRHAQRRGQRISRWPLRKLVGRDVRTTPPALGQKT